MQLVIPTVKYEKDYLETIEESKDTTGITTLPRPDSGQTFEDFLKQIENQSKGIGLREGIVPATTFWLIDNNELIGRVQIRHILNEKLLKSGGHIGYFIRPSKRKQGYGKKILELALEKAKELGIKKTLVTCDITNIGSKKIIEENGGVLENSLKVEEGQPEQSRYWIKIKTD